MARRQRSGPPCQPQLGRGGNHVRSARLWSRAARAILAAEGQVTAIKGGCLCGAVRYTAEAEALSATVCHCRDCQKFTGSAFATLLAVAKEALAVEGAMRTYTSLGGSGQPIRRHFCP